MSDKMARYRRTERPRTGVSNPLFNRVCSVVRGHVCNYTRIYIYIHYTYKYIYIYMLNNCGVLFVRSIAKSRTDILVLEVQHSTFSEYSLIKAVSEI